MGQTFALSGAPTPVKHASPQRLDTTFGLAFAGLGVLQLALIWTHVPWMDELQAVLLAQESHRLADWYWNFRHEGHTPLWHLLLKVPLSLGLSAEVSLKLVLTPFVLATLALVALRAPFPPLWRLLIGFNYFLVFEYGAIARPYSVGVFLLLAAVAFRHRRAAWLAVALLPGCGLQFCLIALVAGWLLVRSRNVWPLGIALAAAGLAIALVWIRPEPDFQSSLSAEVRSDTVWGMVVRTLILAGSVIVATDWNGAPLQWIEASEPMHLTLWMAGAILPILAIAAVRPSRPAMLIVLAFSLITYAISTFKFGLSVRHFGLIFILVLAINWAEARRNGLLLAWITILAIQGAAASANGLRYPFSAWRGLAAWIETAGERDALFVPVGVSSGSEIMVLTGRPTLDLAQGCLQSFTRTRAPSYFALLLRAVGPQMSANPEAARFILNDLRRAAARAEGRVLVLLDSNQQRLLQLAPDPDFRLLAKISNGRPNGLLDRWIYEMRAPPLDPPQPFPSCDDLMRR